MACQLVYDFLVQNKADFLKLSHKFYQKNGYEREFADVFGLEQSMEKGDTRYWDVKLSHEHGEVLLSLKKSKTGTYHLDNVRYCEMYLARNDCECPQLKYPIEAKQQTVTCFFKTDQGRVEKIYIVDTEELFDILNIDETVANQDVIRYEEYRRRDCYQNNQIGIRVKHIQSVAKTIDCLELYRNHVAASPPSINGQERRLENHKTGRRLGINLSSLRTNEIVLNYNQEAIMSMIKRIAKDNIFTMKELGECLPELKKLCPNSYNGHTPKSSLSSNVGQLVKKGKLIKYGKGQYGLALDDSTQN